MPPTRPVAGARPLLARAARRVSVPVFKALRMVAMTPARLRPRTSAAEQSPALLPLRPSCRTSSSRCPARDPRPPARLRRLRRASVSSRPWVRTAVRTRRVMLPSRSPRVPPAFRGRAPPAQVRGSRPKAAGARVRFRPQAPLRRRASIFGQRVRLSLRRLPRASAECRLPSRSRFRLLRAWPAQGISRPSARVVPSLLRGGPRPSARHRLGPLGLLRLRSRLGRSGVHHLCLPRCRRPRRSRRSSPGPARATPSGHRKRLRPTRAGRRNRSCRRALSMTPTTRRSRT